MHAIVANGLNDFLGPGVALYSLMQMYSAIENSSFLARKVSGLDDKCRLR